MVSFRSQASGWYLHVQGIETGPSRIPFQYPCLCHLLAWVSSVDFSCAPNLHSWFVSSLHSPYSHRLPCWPRDIRKLTFFFFLVDWSEERQNEVFSAVLSWCTAACCFRQGLCYDTSQYFSYEQEDQRDLSLQSFSHCPSCLCCGAKHTTV